MSYQQAPASVRIPPAGRPWPLWLRIILPLIILGGGGALAFAFVKSKPGTDKGAPEQKAYPVEVIEVAVRTHPVVVQGQGTVLAARTLVLQPEVTGRVVWHTPELVPGGRVRFGEPLLRINAQDFVLALRQQQSQVASQRLALEVERARRLVAKREWELYQAEQSDEPPDTTVDGGVAQVDDMADGGALAEGVLALRRPHVRSAEIALDSARSAVAQAELRLGRTGLAAPFNAFVQEETVEIGQLVGPASRLATLVGTDAFWVRVSIPVDSLQHLTLPDGRRAGSAARIWLDAGSGRIERSGQVVRLLGDLDPVGRMARLLVEIPDPLGLHRNGAPKPGDDPTTDPSPESRNNLNDLPLLLGSYVHVEIEGHELTEVAVIPTQALQAGDTVYLLDGEDKLDIRKVDVVMRAPHQTMIRGLSTGDRICTSPIATPVPGMALRVLEETDEAAAASTSTTARSTAARSTATSSTESHGASP